MICGMERGVFNIIRGGLGSRHLILWAIFLLPFTLSAQRVNNIAVGTNLVGWAHLITINGEISYPVSREYTAHFRVKFNPWTFNKGSAKQLQSRHLAVAAGVRRWLWYANAGWFYGAGLQYTLFNQGGISSRTTREGWAMGANMQIGYALLLTKHLNLEFGAGFYGAFAKYRIYSCQRCGKIVGNAAHWSLVPNNILLQFVYII